MTTGWYGKEGGFQAKTLDPNGSGGRDSDDEGTLTEHCAEQHETTRAHPRDDNRNNSRDEK